MRLCGSIIAFALRTACYLLLIPAAVARNRCGGEEEKEGGAVGACVCRVRSQQGVHEVSQLGGNFVTSWINSILGKILEQKFPISPNHQVILAPRYLPQLFQILGKIHANNSNCRVKSAAFPVYEMYEATLL